MSTINFETPRTKVRFRNGDHTDYPTYSPGSRLCPARGRHDSHTSIPRSTTPPLHLDMPASLYYTFTEFSHQLSPPLLRLHPGRQHSTRMIPFTSGCLLSSFS